MKITSFTINRSDITKESINNKKYNYTSIVNNKTSPTAETIIASTAIVLLDIYQAMTESEMQYGQAN